MKKILINLFLLSITAFAKNNTIETRQIQEQDLKWKEKYFKKTVTLIKQKKLHNFRLYYRDPISNEWKDEDAPLSRELKNFHSMPFYLMGRYSD